MKRSTSLSARSALTWAIGLLALSGIGAVGCDAGGGGGSDTGAQAAHGAQIGAIRPSFLGLIPQAPVQVVYAGKRRVLVNYTVAGTQTRLDYDEDVWSDGQGNFLIEPGQIFTPPMSTEQKQFFQLIQGERDGFFYRHRDFRIRDMSLFLQNWRVRHSGLQETVAGRSTNVLDIERVGGASARYRAWIDPLTGLVLRAEELGRNDELLSKVEFLSFTLTPDLTGVGLHGDRFPSAPLDLQSGSTSTLGFQVRPPTILPQGYQLDRAESLNDGNANWARIAYGDGVDQIFFLQTLVTPGPQDPNEIDVGPKNVRAFQVGPWTVLQGTFGQDRAIVLGKTDPTSLLRMLKSAFH